MDDEKIIALFCERSEQAISELSKKYGAVCTKIAKNILGDSQDAEECVNDAYLGVWNTIPPNKPEALLTYICRIVRNISIAKYHKNNAQKRKSNYDLVLDELEGCFESAENVEDELTADELSRLIDRFLDGLSRESRVLFIRRYWYSDSIKAISERMNMSENNVSVRLSRIRTKLQQYLKKEGYEL